MSLEDEEKSYQEWLQQQEVIKFPQPEHFKPDFTCYNTGGTVIVDTMIRHYYNLRHHEFLKSDIIISSFPKTGTAWAQELAYLIETMDFQTALTKNLDARCPYLEWPAVPITQNQNTKTNTRFFKTHLPFHLLPKDMIDKECKILYIARNPKDTAVSAYHFQQIVEFLTFKGEFKDFFHVFINDLMIYSPFPKHIKDYWTHRNDKNILYLSYEELHIDIHGNIRNIAEFLNKTLTEEQVQKIANHCSFSSMSANKTTNYSQWQDQGVLTSPDSKYMRKGTVGQWKKYFTEDLEAQFQEWFTKHFADSDVQFLYEV